MAFNSSWILRLTASQTVSIAANATGTTKTVSILGVGGLAPILGLDVKPTLWTGTLIG
jgi:hypothetical protein